MFITSSGTNYSGEVAGGEQVSSVEGEEDNGHGGQDEVVEGDVYCSLATPVGWRYQSRDTQRWATLDLWKK